MHALLARAKLLGYHERYQVSGAPKAKEVLTSWVVV